ncbi:MAG: DegT/DnrJ/EryC1/StrS family aminotransferase [Zavarzinella sp.]
MNTSVPLLDLTAQYQKIRDEVLAAMMPIIESQYFINGPAVGAFESDLSAYCQCSYSIGVTSGSDALLMALMALNIGPGDEVITTPYSFFATAGSIARLGATPVFVDIHLDTYNIAPELIEASITKNTKAIIPVHLFGQCADMPAIMEIANRHQIPVIEDAAQAIGSDIGGTRAGNFGLMSCFSFFPSKNLGAFGDAGAVTTNEATVADKLRLLRMHGSHPKYYHKIVGGNFRIDTLQAAVLQVKLKYLDDWTVGRQKNAHFYTEAIKNDPVLSRWVTPPTAQENYRHIFNQYVIRTDLRDDLRAFLQEAKIGTEIYYPVPLHLQECFAYVGHHVGDFPASEQAATTSLALPIYPELTQTQLDYVVTTLRTFFSSK